MGAWEERGWTISPWTIIVMTVDLLVMGSGLLQWPGGIKTEPGDCSSSIVGNKIQRMTADQSLYPLLQGAPHWLTSAYPLPQIHRFPLHVHTFLPPSFSSVPTTHCCLLNHSLPPDLQIAHHGRTTGTVMRIELLDSRWIHILSRFIPRMTS